MDLRDMGETTQKIYLQGKRDGWIQGFRDGTLSYQKALEEWMSDIEGDDEWPKRDNMGSDDQC